MQRFRTVLVMRRLRVLLIWFLTASFFASVLFRLDAAIFECRLLSSLRKMERFEPGQTDRTELVNSLNLQRLPSCRYGSECLGEQVKSLSEFTFFYSTKLQGVLQNRIGYEIFHWLGFRVNDFYAEFEVRQKKFHSLDYRLLLDNNTYGYPGAMLITAATVYGYPDGPFASEDESPEYSVGRHFNFPEQNLSILFTPMAPVTLVHHAFEPLLNCVWTLRGCRTTKQVLPAAWSDEENIQHTTDVRLHSVNPCPDRILPRRARDTSDILLVKVKDEGPELDSAGTYRWVSYDLLRILKGKVDRPLKHVLYPSAPDDLRKSGQKMPDSDIGLLRPGSRVLMFSNVYTCGEVAATESAMQVIQSALAQVGQNSAN
jgi:hypothetical protein